MWVDEPGSYNGSIRIDNSCRQAINIADRHNLPIADCDVAASTRTARAVDQRPVLD
jgi:aspartate 1-decarboxylase